MAVEVSRAEFQTLANEKLAAAKALLAAGLWSSAYYVSGYVLEHALKACIAKTFKAETLPDKSLVFDTYTHNLVKLVGIANLSASLQAKMDVSEPFTTNWGIANRWSESSRYTTATEEQAKQLIAAIDDRPDGVLVWISANW